MLKCYVFVLCKLAESPACHNPKAEVYFEENISLDCTVRYAGYRHPLVHWRWVLPTSDLIPLVHWKWIIFSLFILFLNSEMSQICYLLHSLGTFNVIQSLSPNDSIVVQGVSPKSLAQSILTVEGSHNLFLHCPFRTLVVSQNLFPLMVCGWVRGSIHFILWFVGGASSMLPLFHWYIDWGRVVTLLAWLACHCHLHQSVIGISTRDWRPRYEIVSNRDHVPLVRSGA